MKAVILAGGLGTRISEETHSIPKPMIEIGGKPILWHIMKIYSAYNINEFIICCGYKGYIIKEYFANYFLHNSDVTIDLNKNDMVIHHQRSEPWKVTLVDTGISTMTGGRIKRIQNYLDNEDFCLTYGDGLSDVNIQDLIEFHKKNGKLVTLTAVSPPGRFGALDISGTVVKNFQEKPKGDHMFINGGFFVVSKEAIKYIDSDETVWESEPLENIAKDKELSAYMHDGFWQPMDTLRDKKLLEDLWIKDAPWKKW